MKKIPFVLALFLFSLVAFAQNTKEYEAGKKAFQEKNYKNAITQFGKVLSKNPIHVMSRYYRGLSYSEIKLYKEAVKDMDEAIKMIPTHADFYYQRAMIKKNQGNKAQVISDLDNAIILDDKNVAYYKERGQLLMTQNQHSEAAADFAMVQSLDPDAEGAREMFKMAFEKVNAEDRNELAMTSGLTAAGFGGGEKPVVRNIPDDKNTTMEKQFLSTKVFKNMEEGKQYFNQLKAKQGFASGKKNALLATVRTKVLQDVYGENPFAEQIEDMKYFVDMETWLNPDGKKYYFNLVSNSQNWFSNGIQRKNVYYFYKAMRYKNSEKYRLQVFAVINNESNLVMSSEIRIKEDSAKRIITIPHAINKGYMWATSNSNVLETTIDLASNQVAFEGKGNLSNTQDKNHGISQDQYNQLVTPADSSSKSSMKATMNYLVLMYPNLFR
jgi:tetratricopeptide (TPR) repeat protein